MEEILGPLGALALALVVLAAAARLVLTGKIIAAKHTVPREDLEAALKIIADYAEGLKTLTKSTELSTKSRDELVTLVKLVLEKRQ